jgi:hypothetical protein
MESISPEGFDFFTPQWRYLETGLVPRGAVLKG